MPSFLGIDTSNYTTSLALFDSDTKEVKQLKKLLPVKQGSLGLRQSDAVFHHTKQLPLLFEEFFKNSINKVQSICVSSRPRNVEGSYMPCFLVGEGYGVSLSSYLNLPIHKTSHQIGHILAGLYSSNKLNITNRKFVAFHISGGTTDCLLCEPDEIDIIKVTQIGTTLDINAGQAVDRVGVMMGLDFPCGVELEKLALKSTKTFNCKTSIKGYDCCLSGVENLAKKMFEKGESREDIAKFCLTFISETLIKMTEIVIKTYGDIPILYVGGVMSNKFIKSNIENKFTSHFAQAEFSSDNAVGCAIFAYLKDKQVRL